MNLSVKYDSSEMVDKTKPQIQQQLDTSTLELAYEKALFHTETTLCEEETRQYRTQNYLLKCENDDLYIRVAQSNNRVNELESHGIRIRTRLDETLGHLEKARLDIRAKSRDNGILTTEINSLQSVTSDSTKLLTEKLSLVRELSCLKPEMEHLRSQAAANQSLLSEKLALQRQLSTVQVELETEKHSAQRAYAKEERQQAEDAKLEIQIESLQADLLKERRQRERSEREAQKAQTDWDSKKTTLESRLDAFRNKLRITKEQLKEAQAELKKAQMSNNEYLNRSAAIGIRKDVSDISRKRTTTQMEDDSTIGTPGNPPVMKKIKKSATLPGDKSTFSITPYLNRTSSVALESPNEFSDKDHDEDMRASYDPLNDQGEEGQPVSLPTINTNGALEKSGEIVRKLKLGSSRTAQIGQSRSGTLSTRNPKIIASLEKVNEGDEEMEKIVPTVPIKEDRTNTALAESLTDNPNTRTRKRKLLGPGLNRALFDGEEEETTKDSRKNLGRRNVLEQNNPFASFKPKSRVGLASPATVFGAISPLKPKTKKVN